jgi:uncharacterized membrane protein
MRRLRFVFKYLLAIFFVLAGLNHFLRTEFYLHIMPPYLPWPRMLVYLSGALEVLLGVMVMIPRWSSVAGWGLVLLLIAVIPANIHMAVNSYLYPEYSRTLLLLRLPVQLILIFWAYWSTRREQRV